MVALIGIIWIATARHAGESAELAKQAQDIQDATTSTSGAEVKALNVAKGASKPGAKDASAGVDATVQLAGETVTVSDQAAGDTVAIDSVSVAKPTWVAIKDTNGWVLGAELINQSEEDASVTLLRATKPGDVYQAVMYVDDGDQTFDLHKDSLVTDNDGAPVASTFKAQ